jgi:hypothetical protein
MPYLIKDVVISLVHVWRDNPSLLQEKVLDMNATHFRRVVVIHDLYVLSKSAAIVISGSLPLRDIESIDPSVHWINTNPI